MGLLLIGVVIGFYSCSDANGGNSASRATKKVSGEIIRGYRVLTIKPEEKNPHFTVYRGDYIKFRFNQGTEMELRIPGLNVSKLIPADPAAAPYFKMKKSGRFPFTLGTVSGEVEVINFDQPNYQEIDSRQAVELIENIQPLILDVRTVPEYEQGHISDATLIPVQELQSRINELSEFKNQDILVYCRSGNRSTVASKILIDNGFNRIYNMRDGFLGWQRNDLPYER